MTQFVYISNSETTLHVYYGETKKNKFSHYQRKKLEISREG